MQIMVLFPHCVLHEMIHSLLYHALGTLNVNSGGAGDDLVPYSN